MNGSHEMLRRTLILLVLLPAACRAQADESAGSAPLEPARAELSLSYAANGEGRSAERIRKAQHLVRTQPQSAQSYLELSRAFLDAKRERGEPVLLAYAGDALAAAEALKPTAPEALPLRGVLLQEDHRFSELAQLATRLIELDPRNSTGYLLLGDAKLELGDYEGAESAYDQAMERYPDLRVYARGAHLRWLHGDIDGALEMMDAALESGAGNREHLAWCLIDVGLLFLRRGESERALAAASAANKLVADYPAAAALAARANLALGKLEPAARAAERALQMRSSAAEHFLLAEIEDARGNHQASQRALAAGLSQAEHDPITVAAHLARSGKDIDRAVQLSAREIDTRPTIEAFGAHALALVRAGKADEAAASLAKALRLGTPLAEFHLTKGLIEVARGDKAGARLALANAIGINPHADPRLRGELTRKIEGL